MKKKLCIITLFLLTLFPCITTAADTVDVEFNFLSYTGNKINYDFTFQVVESGLSVDTGPSYDGRTYTPAENKSAVAFEGYYDPKSSTLPKTSLKPFKPYTVIVKITPQTPERIQHTTIGMPFGLNNIPLVYTRPLRVAGNRVGEKAITYKIPEETAKAVKINLISPFFTRQNNPAYNPDDPASKPYTYKKEWRPYPYDIKLSITRKTTGIDSTAQAEAIVEHLYDETQIVLPYGIYDFYIRDSKYVQGKELKNIVIKKDRNITLYLRKTIEKRNISDQIADYNSTCANLLMQYPDIYDNTFDIKSLPQEAQECYYATFKDSIHNIPKELLKQIPVFPYARDKTTAQKIPISGVKIYATDKQTKETLTFDLSNITKEQTTGTWNNNLIELPPHRTFYISCYKEGYDAGGTIEFYTNKKSRLYFNLRKLEDSQDDFDNFPEEKKKSIWFDVRDSVTKEPVSTGKLIITSINYDTTIEREFTNYQTNLKLPPGTYTFKVQAENYADAMIREYRIPARQNWSQTINFTLIPVSAMRKYTIDIKLCKEIKTAVNSLECIPFDEENVIFMGLDEEEVSFYTKGSDRTNIKKTYWSYMDRRLPDSAKGGWLEQEFSKHTTPGNIVQALLGDGTMRLEGELPLGQIFYIKGYLKFKHDRLEFKIKMPTAKIDTRPFNKSFMSCSQNNTFCTNVVLARDWKEPAKVEIMKAVRGRLYDIKIAIKDPSTKTTQFTENIYPISISGRAIANHGDADESSANKINLANTASKIWLPDNYTYELTAYLPQEDVTAYKGQAYNASHLYFPDTKTVEILFLHSDDRPPKFVSKKNFIKTPTVNPKNNKNEIVIYSSQSSKFAGRILFRVESLLQMTCDNLDPKTGKKINLKITVSNPDIKYKSTITLGNKDICSYVGYRNGSYHSATPTAIVPEPGTYHIAATLTIYDPILKQQTYKKTLNLSEQILLTPNPYMNTSIIALDFVGFAVKDVKRYEKSYPDGFIRGASTGVYSDDGINYEESVSGYIDGDCMVLYFNWPIKPPQITFVPEGIKRLTKETYEKKMSETNPKPIIKDRDGSDIIWVTPEKIVNYSYPPYSDPPHAYDTFYCGNLTYEPPPQPKYMDYEGNHTKRKIKIVLSAAEPFRLTRFHIDPARVTKDNLDLFFNYGKITKNCLDGTNCIGTWENSYTEFRVYNNSPFAQLPPVITMNLIGKGSATTHTKTFTVSLPVGSHRVEINVVGMSKAVEQLDILPDDPPDKEYLLQYQLQPLPSTGNIKQRFLILKLVSDKKDIGFEGVTPIINIGGKPKSTVRAITQGAKTDWFAYIGGVPIPMEINPQNKFETTIKMIPLGELAGGTEVTYQAYTSETATALSRSYLGRAFYNMMNLTSEIFNLGLGEEEYIPTPEGTTPIMEEAKAQELYKIYEAELSKYDTKLPTDVHRPKGGRLTIPDDDQYIVRKILLPVGPNKGQDDDDVYDVDVIINAMSDRGFHSSAIDFIGILSITKALTSSTKGLDGLRKIGWKAAEEWFKTRKYHLDNIGDELLEAIRASNWGIVNNAADKTARIDWTGKYIYYNKDTNKILLSGGGINLIRSSFQYKGQTYTESLIAKIEKELNIANKLSKIDYQSTASATYVADKFSEPIENTAKALKRQDWHENEAKFLEKKIAKVNKALDKLGENKFGEMASQTTKIATVLTQQPFTKALQWIEKKSKLTILTPLVTTVLPFAGLPPSGMPLIQLKTPASSKMAIPETKEMQQAKFDINFWWKNLSIKPTKAEPLKVRLKTQNGKPISIKAIAQGHDPFQAYITSPPPNEDGSVPQITIDMTMVRNEGWMFESTENFFSANPLLAESFESLFFSPEMFYGTSETPGVWESFIKSTGSILFDSICKDLWLWDCPSEGGEKDIY